MLTLRKHHSEDLFDPAEPSASPKAPRRRGRHTDFAADIFWRRDVACPCTDPLLQRLQLDRKTARKLNSGYFDGNANKSCFLCLTFEMSGGFANSFTLNDASGGRNPAERDHEPLFSPRRHIATSNPVCCRQYHRLSMSIQTWANYS
jgi:hypothetical protein